MNERADSAEFLLGIEEYLKYHKHERMGSIIHSLSRALSLDNKRENTVKIFFQEFGGGIATTNLELSDLMHKVVKSENFKDLRVAVLYYIAKKYLKNQNLVDYVLASIKSNSSYIIRFNTVKFLAKEIEDINLKNLIFSTIKSSSNDENIFKTAISFLDKEREVKGLTFEDLRQELENLVNLEVEQDKKELASLILKFGNMESVIKSLLQYVGKVKDDNELLSYLAFSIKKTDDVAILLKIILQFISKYVILEEHVEDLIHGFTKEDKDDFLKSFLLYLSKSKDEYELMNELSIALRKALMSDNFENDVIKGYLAMLDRSFLGNKVFRGINNYIKNDYEREPLNDAFSRSQIKSKIWLVEELSKIKEHFANVLILASWFGQLKSFYDGRLSYNKMRMVDIDKSSCEISDYIFNLSNLEGYKVKSVCADINNLVLHKNGYELPIENFKEGNVILEKFLPDLIINTSAEHTTEEWYKQLRFKELESSPIVVIQSNNLFDVPEHINCVYSTQHLLKKFPMTEVLFEGELQLKGYKRIMIIGKP